MVEDLTAALTAGDRGAHPPGRRDQAPGEDGHRRHLALRRGAAAGRRWSREVLAAGAARDALSYRALRTLVALDPAVEQVTGFTRYRIEGDLDADDATIHVVDRGGISVDLRSRTDDDPAPAWVRSTGSRRSARSRWRAAGATAARVVIVPEVKDNETVGLTLLHARFADAAPRRRRAHACSRATRVATARCATRSPRPSPTFDDARARRRSTSSTCSPSRSTCSPTAGADVGARA